MRRIFADTLYWVAVMHRKLGKPIKGADRLAMSFVRVKED
jgi:hypothetical protein